MLLYVYVIILSDHGFLIRQVNLVLLNQSLSIIDRVSDLVKSFHIPPVFIVFELFYPVFEKRVLDILMCELYTHFVYLLIVLLQFSHNHLFIVSTLKQRCYVSELLQDLRQFLICGVLCSFKKLVGLFIDLPHFCFKQVDLVCQVTFFYFI